MMSLWLIVLFFLVMERAEAQKDETTQEHYEA